MEDFNDIINDPGLVEVPESVTEQGVKDINAANSAQSAEAPKETLETFGNLDPNSQLNNLETKEVKLDVEEKEGEKDEPESKEEDAGKEEEVAGKEEQDKGKETPKIEGKTLKLFKDGERYEVPVDATVKVKVNGKNEIVPISELKDNYSGKQAWEKKMPELAEKERTVEAKEVELTRVQQTLRTNLENTRQELLDSLENKANPLDSLNKIVDMLGVDSYDFNKAVFESMLDEVLNLQQMDEAEQEAYWLRKQNTHINNKHASLAEQDKQAKAREGRIASIDRMREAHGVSEDDFVSAYEELSQSGREVTPEEAVRYAQTLPLLQTAEEALKPYEDQLSDDEFDSMMAKIAQAMKNDKSITKEDVATYLSEFYQVPDLVDSVNKKAEKLEAGKRDAERTQKEISQQNLYSNSTYESFEDLTG